MVDLLRFGCETRAGEYICADCGHLVELQESTLLPICPAHAGEPHVKRGWRVLYGRIGPHDRLPAPEARP